MNTTAYVITDYTKPENALDLLNKIGSLRHPTSHCYPSGCETDSLATLLAMGPDPRWRVHPLGVFLRPVVGMGMTECFPSDRYPYEVVRVISDITIDVRGMNFTLAPDSPKMEMGCDNQKWIYTSCPEGSLTRLRFNSRGHWMHRSIPFALGHMRYYRNWAD